jgi:anti-sigma B factor antagonist
MSVANEPDGPNRPLELRREGLRAIIVLRGRIDSSTADPLVALVSETLREGAEELALEMAEVTFVSSAGIGAILRSQADAKRAGVRFRVISVSEAVRGVFRLARIEQLLAGEAAAPAPARTPASANRTVSYDAWNGRFRRLDATATATVRIVGRETVSLGPRDFALGIGCLGDASQLAELDRRGGETLAVGRVAASLPTDTDLIDFLAAADGVGCPVSFAEGLAVHGPMRWAIDLTEVRTSGVGISSLANECLDLCKADAVAIVAAAEAAGVVGAHLRSPPGHAAGSIRERLAFTTEPMHECDTLVLAGVVARAPAAGGSQAAPPTPLKRALRPIGEGLLGHLHGLAMSYRPIPIEPADPAPLVASLVTEQRPLGLYHLVHDDRRGGAGETRLRRGTVFCVPIAAGGLA